jgi:hypothetical protein
MTQTSTKNEAYSAAKEILKDKGLNPEILGREGLSIDEYIIGLVIDSLKKLSLVKTTLHDENLLKLEGYELDGIREAADEIFNLLDASVGLHTATH